MPSLIPATVPAHGGKGGEVDETTARDGQAEGAALPTEALEGAINGGASIHGAEEKGVASVVKTFPVNEVGGAVFRSPATSLAIGSGSRTRSGTHAIRNG
jgi:hypothetical protein